MHLIYKILIGLIIIITYITNNLLFFMNFIIGRTKYAISLKLYKRIKLQFNSLKVLMTLELWPYLWFLFGCNILMPCKW